MITDQDISKYGFYVVIGYRKDVRQHHLIHDYDGVCDCAQFKSEKAAELFAQECRESSFGEGWEYYCKYVSWGRYD